MPISKHNRDKFNKIQKHKRIQKKENNAQRDASREGKADRRAERKVNTSGKRR